MLFVIPMISTETVTQEIHSERNGKLIKMYSREICIMQKKAVMEN